MSQLQEDYEEMLADPLPPQKPPKTPWKLLFDPELLLEEHEELNVEDFSLSEHQLRKFGMTCSKIRSNIRERAALTRELEEDDVSDKEH